MIIHWLHPPFLGCWNMLKPHLSAPLHQALRLHQAQGRLRRFRRRHLRHGLLVDSYCVYIYMYIIYPHVKYSHVLSVCLSIYLSIDRSTGMQRPDHHGERFSSGLTRNGRADTLAGLFYEDWDVTDIRQGVKCWIRWKIDFSRKIQEDSGSLVSKLQ